MKMTRKINSLIALMLFLATANTYTMKRTLEEDTPIRLFLENFDFNGLPQDVQGHIIQLLSLSATTTSLKETVDTIKSLSLTNRALNEMINNPYFCLQLIQSLAYKFKCSDTQAAEALNTPEAKNRLELQKKLQVAVVHKDIYKIINLCHKGADPSFTYSRWEGSQLAGMPALLYAIEKNNPTMIKLLLENGANINKGNKGGPALIWAVVQGKIELVEYLLGNPTIAIDQQDDHGNTALTFATKKNNCPLIKLLLSNGANINHANKDGVTPLMFAVLYGHSDAVQCLLNNPTIVVDQQELNGATALMVAAIENDCPMIKLLLSKGADINKTKKNGASALGVAISKKSIDAAECLLSNPTIVINQQNDKGTTVLLGATIAKDKVAMKLLIDADADPEIANNDGLTPLQAAQETNNQEIIDLIQNAINKKHEKK